MTLPVSANLDQVVIEPQLERRDITEADIDSENFEVALFAGQVSVEDFSSGVLVGASLTYHVSENLFAEMAYGQAEAGQTSYEILSGGAQFLTDEERQYRYYDLAIGYKFNGEVFVSQGRALNSDFYFMLGGGNTDFAADSHFTLVLGAGYRLLLTDYLALRLDARDRIFSSELIGEQKETHNMQYTLGVSLFF
ncbi:outer membrane beta-barrel domain-containing protein [Alteromonas aestuariivivens]|uniref:Outer membrane beta-barrel domain-containing protein n=2 Tax=Alteromonas aestuariivivens TaxID=1938339 RepID=A0A3D8MD67_9ALTE|nr:outer membrane beta-barrel domain-containing protein [Alteromonas aestuariivivens]